ncbi:ion channel protein [Streptomyces sp. SID6673]|nr:ion channel protein [Streptomyces sp. SID11726]NEB26209.1 ion channel protein [Streptomyces sp. SID6673]
MSPEDSNPQSAEEFRVPVGRLIAMTPVGMVVGTICALLLWGISALAELIEHLIWDDLTDALGISSDTWWWIVLVLTATGLLVGLVVRYVPGHAGEDPATTELVATPLAPSVVPGLAVAAILGLAGGISLGPENPIMAINAALVVAIGARFVPKVTTHDWVGLSTSATIGALFGTPVAAALMLSEVNEGDQRVPLWNRLYIPLVAAATGSFVITHFTDLDMSLGLPADDFGGVAEVFVAIGVAMVAAAVGVVAARVFDPLHKLLHRIGNPILLLTAAGLALGLLGVAGGTITLFKGLDQMKELPDRMATTTALGFLAMAGIKLVALLIASAAGFRGGRIFPAVFVGAALGFAVHALWPDLPVTVTVAAATAGIVVAATRNGWMSLFLALAVVPQLDLLIPMLFATLAAWLVVVNRAELRATPILSRPAQAPTEST